MTALLSLTGNEYTTVTRTPLGDAISQRDEKWFQKLLFQNPAVIPVEDVHPGASRFIPVCRELTIPKPGGNSVYLDLFGITPEAKLVLIECKLWRNPQARREVVAQMLEYASLLCKWSYNDLAARLQNKLETKADNPLFKTYQKAGGALDEEKVHDRVARALKAADFLVIIAGNGIREDVLAIADLLNQNSGMATSFALAEFQIFSGASGEEIIIPRVPVRTEVLTHRAYIGSSGEPLTIESEDEQEDARTNALINPEDAAFWQDFCDHVKFDHPDQPPARRGGLGWAKLPMPKPVNWITAYRTAKGTAGFFFSLKGDEGQIIYQELNAARSKLEDELGAKLKDRHHKSDPFEIKIYVDYPDDPFEDKAFLAWLIENANRVVSTLRPFLATLRPFLAQFS